MKSIIAALDFSDATAPVLETAVRMAKAFGAVLRLVHVLEPEPTYAAYGFTPEEFPAIHAFQKEARLRARKALEEQVAKVEGSFTGHYLKPMLKRAQAEPVAAQKKKQREAAG